MERYDNSTQAYRILALNWRCLRHPEAGGAEQNIFEQARRWVADGHEVTLLCADPGREYVPERDEVMDGIQVRRMGGRFSMYLMVAWFLLRYGRHYDYIVDVANGIPFFSPLFTRTPGILLVHHVHDRQWFSEFSYPLAMLGWFLESKVVPLVFRHRPVVAVSPTTRDALLRTGFDEQQLHVIYNGVQLPAATPATEVKRQHIAYVGRVKRYKRLDLLVRSVATLRPCYPDVRLDLAGDGDALEEIGVLVNELGLQDAVTIHGRVSEAVKADILQHATVFATPSMHEGWGLAVIEANAQGCPAVAYDVPGLRVAIRDGETGLLAADDAAFTAALATLLDDQALRDHMAANARQWAARFDWRSCANATLEVMVSCNEQRPEYQSI